MRRAAVGVMATMMWVALLPGLARAGYVFTDQTPTTPVLTGAYQRYPTLLGDGTTLELWYENRTTSNIEMRTSTTGYAGFGSAAATSGLAGLGHPRIYGGGSGGGGYVGFFWDSVQSPPSGIKRLTSSDGVSWGVSTDVSIAGSPGTSSIWGVCGYFEDVSGTTDVLYYTQGTGGVEHVHRATATDGIHFTHQGTAFQNPGGNYGAGVSVGSQVVYDANNGDYMLIWCAEAITHHIGYAASIDGGLTFSNQGTVVLDSAGHTDLEETAFVLNGAQLVGLYTGDFAGDSSNHIGAYTGEYTVPEPGLLGLLAAGWFGLLRKRRG